MLSRPMRRADLFDEVDLALEVGTARRRDRDERVARLVVDLDVERRAADALTRRRVERRCRAARSPARCARVMRGRSIGSGYRSIAPVDARRRSRPPRAAPSRAPRRLATPFGIDAALEARARLGAQAEPLRRSPRCPRARSRPTRAGSRVVAPSTSESRPPMIPAIACGARSASQMRRSSTVSVRSTPSSVVMFSPGVAQPHDDARDRRGGRGRTRAAAGSARASRSW